MAHSRTDGVSISNSIATGALAWVTGLVVTFVVGLLAIDVGIGLLFRIAPFEGTLAAFIYLHSGALATGISWLVVIPAGLLVIGGMSVAPGTAGDPATGFKHGTTVAVGYALMAGLTTVLIIDSRWFEIVDMVFAGVVFPIVFGGLGGVLAESI
ncbi:hypothetical protein [Halapricum salinum]|uniref:DUF7978 domain-containing protein n=1 Tax=Halapricum salinum TaxID=1457250 RepID=A0A4D6HB05_9EURY|nr:hypothetical protein [Halapricum salinum]QCC50232.1 hypothetical protein DV733_02835 [Halapricum salinum]